MNMVRHCSGACCKQACNLGSGWGAMVAICRVLDSGDGRWWVGCCSTSKAQGERKSDSPHSQGMTSDCLAVAIPAILCHCWLTGCS